MHFLLNCEFYHDLRFHLFYYIEEHFNDEHFYDMSDNDKFIFLMNTPRLQHKLANVLYDMYQRRKAFL